MPKQTTTVVKFDNVEYLTLGVVRRGYPGSLESPPEPDWVEDIDIRRVDGAPLGEVNLEELYIACENALIETYHKQCFDDHMAVCQKLKLDY